MQKNRSTTTPIPLESTTTFSSPAFIPRRRGRPTTTKIPFTTVTTARSFSATTPARSVSETAIARRKFTLERTRFSTTTLNPTTITTATPTRTKPSQFRRRFGVISDSTTNTKTPSTTSTPTRRSSITTTRLASSTPSSIFTKKTTTPIADETVTDRLFKVLPSSVDQEILPSFQDSQFTNTRFNQIGESLTDGVIEAITTISRAPLPFEGTPHSTPLSSTLKYDAVHHFQGNGNVEIVNKDYVDIGSDFRNIGISTTSKL